MRPTLFITCLVALACHQLVSAANLIEGKYTLDHADNFDSYLDALGVNVILRNGPQGSKLLV
jgi:hypothetical protein